MHIYWWNVCIWISSRDYPILILEIISQVKLVKKKNWNERNRPLARALKPITNKLPLSHKLRIYTYSFHAWGWGLWSFQKVSSCGPRARLSGELWRDWRRLACWMKKPVTFAFCGTATTLSSLSSILPLLPPSPTSSPSALEEDYRQKLDVWSCLALSPLLYPSDKALCISFSSRLLYVSHSDSLLKKIRVKPFCCLLFDVSDLAVVYLAGRTAGSQILYVRS